MLFLCNFFLTIVDFSVNVCDVMMYTCCSRLHVGQARAAVARGRQAGSDGQREGAAAVPPHVHRLAELHSRAQHHRYVYRRDFRNMCGDACSCRSTSNLN